MLKILVADDDAGIRDVLREILVAEGHVVTEASDGENARVILSTGDFDLVISDMQMPHLSGVALLEWVQANKRLPFMLITGFSNIFETKQAFDLGANEFLNKPFTRKEVAGAIERAMQNAAPGGDDQEKHYCKIPIEDFVSSAGFQVNVYAKLSDTKFVRVAHKGDLIPTERVETYQKKGVNFLYAKKEEFAKVVGFNLSLSQVMTSSKAITQAKKLRFLKYTSELVLENAFVNGLDADTFDQATKCLDVCLSVVTENEKLFETLEMLNRHSNWLYAHSLGVSIYSVMIARKMGWKGQATFFKLSTAGLFHDIGEKELPAELLTKPRGAMSAEERQLYETHPSRGKEILQDLGGLSEDIIQVVHEHHEEGLGQGYPRRMHRSKIHPMVRIISLADKFCYLVLNSPTSEGVTADVAIAKILQQAGNELDQKELMALVSIVTPKLKTTLTM